MKILSKKDNELLMLAMKTDTASKGDYLLIEDEKVKKKMIAQIYDEEYLSGDEWGHFAGPIIRRFPNRSN